MAGTNQPTASDTIRHGIRYVSVWFTVGAYTVLAPMGCALFAVLALLGRRDEVRLARRLQRVQVFAYRFMHDWLRWTAITDFDHRRDAPRLPARPCVIIANHPTLMDITAITAVAGGGCTIVKPELYHRRLVRPLVSLAGHMEGPARDLVSIGRVVDDAVERIRQGFSVIVFPEGTRSRKRDLLPFSRTPFEIACRAGVPLVSLTVDCEPAYLSKEIPLFRPPHPTPILRMGALAQDDPADYGGDSRALRIAVEARYRDWAGQPDTKCAAPHDSQRKEPNVR